MIYVLQHKKTNKYVKAAVGNINMRTLKTKDIKFTLVDDISQARIIENPDMASVNSYGMIAVGVTVQNNKIVKLFKVYEHNEY